MLPRDRPQPTPPIPALERDRVSWGEEGMVQGGAGKTSRSGSHWLIFFKKSIFHNDYFYNFLHNFKKYFS